MSRLPRLLRFGLYTLLLQLALFSVLRVVFWLWFENPADPLPGATAARALYLGLKFDLRLLLLVMLPVLLLGWMRPLSPFGPAAARWLWIGYLTLAVSGIMLVYAVDFGHYAYLHRSLDATALRFLENPLISAQMVWETYPVLWGVLALVLFAALHGWLLQRLVQHLAAAPAPTLRRWQKAMVAPLSLVVVLFGMYGQVSWYPLRWSNAFFSTHAFAPAVTVNPVLYFVSTLKNRDVSFDRAAATEYYADMVEYLGIDRPNAAQLDYSREIVTDRPARQPNVVIVLLESFASFKTGLYGNPLNPTPNLDAIARAGVYFENFFTPSTGTARSVFTAITGIPDIEPVKTSTRNPLIVDQHTIVNAFEGYDKLYFLGGSANWGNIRGLLARNIPGLSLYEEGSYDAPRVDVWGIADHHLFEEAHKVLSAPRERPFFAIIQTSGNHRPYTIPEDRHGFELDNRADAELQRLGFINNGEYNSFRFMDHSIGLFMDSARAASYASNTVFVFFGDHGVPGTGDHISAADQQLALLQLRVPLVFYAPGLITEPRTVSTLASEVDVLPSIAALVLPRYKNTTLGRDLFDPRFDDKRYAFTVTHGSQLEIGLVDEQFYYVTNADGSGARLHDLHATTPRDDVAAQHPEAMARMQRLNRAIYETARYMRYHNKPENIAASEQD
ncbi:MAG: sulfatase-like hydrolase/transferase [Pseudomonadota bacterium]|nr:MAG: sulfatase-like hydrolase/transferase [Pseudomonadota bacterium]